MLNILELRHTAVQQRLLAALQSRLDYYLRLLFPPPINIPYRYSPY